MKTAILYAGKYGATADIAGRLAARLDGAEVFDLGNGPAPDIADFDCVVIGSALYAGMVRKPAKAFVEQNQEALIKKQLALFFSGMQPGEDNAAQYSAQNYPAAVVSHATVKACLGGRFDPEKANFFERFIFKMVAKEAASRDTLSDEAIEAFAGSLLYEA